MPWTDDVAGMNAEALDAFGIPVTHLRGTVETQFTAIESARLSPDSQDSGGFRYLQFRRSDVPSVGAGDKITTETTEYRIVEVDFQIENWVKATIQRMRDLL